MKTSIKLFALGMILMGFGVSVNAQSTATASTTATLVVPISIAKTTDMNFGTVAASATAGTVALDYINGRTATGGASLPAGSVTQKTAVFTVTGEGSSTFSIAVPSAPITLNGSVSGTMTVDNFVADLGAAATLVSGSKVINVKAILNVPANAVAGTYTNASGLFVTVNYN
ncbi:MAG: DUF4402 domain-containing protein [Bacteroidia bacterium]|nr:DUF4402 domain-containing protein [Bacteroidia bacterium]